MNEVMLKKKISELIKALDINISDPNTKLTIKKELLIKYQSYIKQSTEAILQESLDKDIYENFKNFLDTNWNLIKGSFLSYTALNENSVTKLLCEIADILCEYKNHELKKDMDSEPLTPIKFLMPNITLESSHPDYPSLSAIKNFKEALSKDEIKELNSNKDLKFIELTNHEDNVFKLYTDLVFRSKQRHKERAFDDIWILLTNKLKEIIEEQSEKNNDDEYQAFSKDFIKFLKTQIDTNFQSLKEKINVKIKQEQLIQLRIKAENIKKESEHQAKLLSIGFKKINNYLVPSFSLEQILKRHIESDDASSLVPVSVILEDNSINPYESNDFDLSEFTLIRLYNHSALSLAIHNAQKQMQLIENDKDTFLGHLNEFCSQLKIYDSHEGFGLPDDAGSGAYPAIIKFKDYCNHLDIESSKKVPDEIKNAISKIFTLSSDSSKNHKSTENMETCIGNRRKEIQRLLTDDVKL